MTIIYVLLVLLVICVGGYIVIRPRMDPVSSGAASSNISEPVYKLVEVFKQNPLRFKFKFVEDKGYRVEYQIRDIKTGEIFDIWALASFYNGVTERDIGIHHNITFTKDEINYMFYNLSPYIKKRLYRLERMHDLIQKRSDAEKAVKQKQARADLYEKLSRDT